MNKVKKADSRYRSDSRDRTSRNRRDSVSRERCPCSYPRKRNRSPRSPYSDRRSLSRSRSRSNSPVRGRISRGRSRSPRRGI
jgi:hypothetical protein